jgi:hypothetical protein
MFNNHLVEFIKEFFNIKQKNLKQRLRLQNLEIFTVNLRISFYSHQNTWKHCSFGVIAFTGSWLTPTTIRWSKAKRHQNKLRLSK